MTKTENFMNCNVGKADKIARIIVGACIIAAGVYFQSWWGAIGIIPLATAAMGWCPLYIPLGINSCKK